MATGLISGAIAFGGLAIAVATFLKALISERPIIKPLLPLTADDFPDHTKNAGYEWFALRLENFGNHPARISRIAINTVILSRSCGTGYPTPMHRNLDYIFDARGTAHALGPGQRSQYLQIVEDFEKYRPLLQENNMQIFVQILVEYEDNFGRSYMNRSQYRFNRDLGGFRLAWPSKPGSLHYASRDDYCGDVMIRNFSCGLAKKLWSRFIEH